MKHDLLDAKTVWLRRGLEGTWWACEIPGKEIQGKTKLLAVLRWRTWFNENSAYLIVRFK